MTFSARRLALVLAAALGAVPSLAAAKDKLVVLSPHRKTIQEEFVPLFQKWYQAKFGTEVEVEWIDQGGTSNAVKYAKGKVASNPKDSGLDVFWGGTAANFVDMAASGTLEPYALPEEARAEVPTSCAGVQLSDSQSRWHASVISSFGIMFNKPALALEKLPAPATWSDLADARYLGGVAATDPRKSGTASTMNMVVLAAEGWDKGWESLYRIAGNTRRFTDSSSDPVRAVAAGDATAAMVIDFYGLAQVWELGADKIGFVLPEGRTVLDPDPVALVKGGAHRQVATRFIDFLMTRDAQKVWILPKGAPGGPVRNNLARLAVSPKAYEETEGKRLVPMNPFQLKSFLKMDLEKAGLVRDAFNDLVGTVHVDLHEELKKAWQRVVKDGMKPEAVAAFAKPPVTEPELQAAARKWSDSVYRNETINAWTAAAKERYRKLAAGEVVGKSH